MKKSKEEVDQIMQEFGEKTNPKEADFNKILDLIKNGDIKATDLIKTEWDNNFIGRCAYVGVYKPAMELLDWVGTDSETATALVNYHNRNGNTPLTQCANSKTSGNPKPEEGRFELFTKLLSIPEVDVEATNKKGESALTFAEAYEKESGNDKYVQAIEECKAEAGKSRRPSTGSRR